MKAGWVGIAGLALLAGGVAWLSKLAVIAATAGWVTDTGAAGLFYLIGLVLLLSGSTGLGMRLTIRLGALLRTVAVILSPVLFVASFLVFDVLTGVVLGDWGPVYIREEADIFVAAVVWIAVGAVLLGFVHRRSDAEVVGKRNEANFAECRKETVGVSRREQDYHSARLRHIMEREGRKRCR